AVAGTDLFFTLSGALNKCSLPGCSPVSVLDDESSSYRFLRLGADNDHVYFWKRPFIDPGTDPAFIDVCPRNGTCTPVDLVNDNSIAAFTVAGSDLYWLTGAASTVWHCTLPTCGTPSMMTANFAFGRDLAVDDANIYVVSDTSVWRMPR